MKADETFLTSPLLISIIEIVKSNFDSLIDVSGRMGSLKNIREYTHKNNRDGLVVMIFGLHPNGSGSTPDRGILFGL